MKVLLVCHGYPPFGVAGVERVSAQSAERLTARGHEVTVLTRRESRSPAALMLERDRRNGVPVVTIAGAGGPQPEGAPEQALEAIFERMLFETTPDVVLITHLHHHAPGYVDIAHRWGVPVVLELHDFYALCPRAHLLRVDGQLCAGPEDGAACATHCFPDDPRPARWTRRARAFAHAVQAADAVLSPSPYAAEVLAPLRANAAPIEVIGNGVGPLAPTVRERPHGTDATLRLAGIGVTVEHKGFHVVMEALRRAALPAARFTIFGIATAPEEGEMRAAAAEIPGLELQLFGQFEPHFLPILLGDVDLVVIPSIVAETYSLVAREALACGVPIAASRIGALPDAVRPGKNGWLFEPGAADELAALLQRLDGDRDELRRAADGIRADDVLPTAARVARLEALLTGVAEASAQRRLLAFAPS